MVSVSVAVLIGVAIIVGLGWGLRRALQRHDTARPGEGRAARQFFQYLLLYGLLVVAATGVSGLVARLFDAARVLTDGNEALALYTTFTVVGVPLYGALAWWTRKRFQADPAEGHSRAWLAYVTLASLTALYSTLVGLHGVLSWTVGLTGYEGSYFGALIVWGAAWLGHWWVDLRLTGSGRFMPNRFLGSVIGLVICAIGATWLLGDAIEVVLGTGPEPVFAGGRHVLLPGAVLLATGLPVWLVYWVVPRRRYERKTLWLVHVLLVGVGGGLVTAVTAASLALYDLLVWLVGEPSSTVATTHFNRVPHALAAVAIGAVVWWYHRAVVQEERGGDRTEVRRVYEYLIAGIGLGAAAVGLMLMLVALLEALAGPSDVLLEHTSAINTVLAAATLLVVGGPVWWFFWRRIGVAAATAPAAEHGSPTRRVYVVILFGVVGVAAVGALLSGVFVVLQDVFGGSVSAETLRAVRYPVGIIVTAGLVSGYHWSVYRADREGAQVVKRGPRFVLLVGPADPEIAHELSQRTRGRVELWPRRDGEGPAWSADELATALMDRPDAEVVVLAEGGRLTVVPVDRS